MVTRRPVPLPQTYMRVGSGAPSLPMESPTQVLFPTDPKKGRFIIISHIHIYYSLK